jgi:hypothetical protein
MRTQIQSFAVSAFLFGLLLSLFVCSAVAQEDPPAASADSAVNAAPKLNPTLKLDLNPDAHGGLSQQQMQELFRVVASKFEENDDLRRNYTYIERSEEAKLDGDGQTKSTEVRTYEVMELYGEQVRRLIEKDDKPLPEKDKAKEEEKIQKFIDKRKGESDDDRRKREEKEEKEREDGRKFVREVADAYNFTLVGTEVLGGREAWVIDGEPRPGYEPHMKEAKFLPKFHGRVWIDKDDLQLAKLQVEAIETVAIGLLVARVHKGTRFVQEQTRVNEEVWLPSHVAFKLDARVALFKGYNQDTETTFRDYKKFRTSAKIVGLGDAKP